jgi:hypothetical protein
VHHPCGRAARCGRSCCCAQAQQGRQAAAACKHSRRCGCIHAAVTQAPTAPHLHGLPGSR